MYDSFNEQSTHQNEQQLIMRARNLIASEREEDALNVVRQALKVNPNNPVSLLLYGQLNPNSDHAIKALKKVLSIDPHNPTARLYLRILQGNK